ncbi:hypothetical protein [Bacillus phage SPbetaL2]|nr:hypothetical protein [Bacillus phage SPbetaL2]
MINLEKCIKCEEENPRFTMSAYLLGEDYNKKCVGLICVNCSQQPPRAL